MDRVVLKISGEALKDDKSLVSKDKLKIILNIINILQKKKKKIAIVIGGGNFFRGREHTDMDVINRDSIGIFSSIINAFYLKDYLEQNSVKTIVKTPFNISSLTKDYSDKELNDAYNDKVLVFGGGTGISGCSTDSGVINASKILNSDLIIKLTKVDGVYDKDPEMYSDAIKINSLTYDEVINKDLKVMDIDLVKYAKDNNIKILVMNYLDYELLNNDVINFGTIIRKEG